MKKNILFCLLSMLLILSCSTKELDMRVQLVDGIIGFWEEKGFSCDTTFNDVTNQKHIDISQKELFLHYFPEQKEAYELAVEKVLETHNAKEGDGMVVLPLADFTNVMHDHVVNMADSLKNYIVGFTSLEPNRSYPNPSVHGYRWMYDSLQCEFAVNNMISSFDGISIYVNMTNDRVDENDIVEYDTKSQDQCVLLLKKLYEDYVLYDDLADTRKVEPKPFETVVDDFFTQKGKQKLIDAYENEYDGEIESGGEVGYAIWTLRSSAQDSSDEDVAQVGLKEVLPLGNNKYAVKYYDMGVESEAVITFAEENGKLKIDDFKSDDKSYDLGR